MIFSEIKVTVKDDERTLIKKYPVYEVYQISSDDPIIKKYVEETVSEFRADPDSVRINISAEI